MATIDLAHADSFKLGAIIVRPSTRELVAADGAATILEPKVVQMLVALASPAGRVVSRSELVERCWGDRIVGEDAINRIVAKLRRAGAVAAGGAFRVETVARVGYRLAVAADGVPAPPAVVTAARGERRIALMSALVLLVLLAAVAAPSWYRRDAAPPTAEVLPPAVSDLETRGLAAMFENTPDQTTAAVAYLRQATALAPRAAPVWGSLAMSYVLSLGWVAAAERPAAAARVREAAAHALAIDPRESRSLAALVSLEPTFGAWDRKAAALRSTAARAHSADGPIAYQQVQFLLATGHTREALATAERLMKASPLVPWIQAARVDLLAAAGRLDEADRAAAQAQVIWPRERLTWFTRFDLAAFGGEPERALAMAEDRAGWPEGVERADVALAARVARTLATRDPAEVGALMPVLRADAARGKDRAERAMRAASALGQPADALDFARIMLDPATPTEPRATLLPQIGYPTDADPPTAALFLPPAAALWSDPGLMRIVADIGLLAFWRRSGAPDLCATRAGACRAAGLAGFGLSSPACAHVDPPAIDRGRAVHERYFWLCGHLAAHGRRGGTAA